MSTLTHVTDQCHPSTVTIRSHVDNSGYKRPGFQPEVLPRPRQKSCDYALDLEPESCPFVILLIVRRQPLTKLGSAQT